MRDGDVQRERRKRPPAEERSGRGNPRFSTARRAVADGTHNRGTKRGTSGLENAISAPRMAASWESFNSRQHLQLCIRARVMYEAWGQLPSCFFLLGSQHAAPALTSDGPCAGRWWVGWWDEMADAAAGRMEL